MHVVVTGGTGLVGSHLVERLRQRGDEATVVSRKPTGPDQVGWDPHEEDSLQLPAEADAVVHLAGAPIVGERWTEAKKRAIRESRVEGTRRVVEAVEKHDGIDRVVSGSAVGYYGDRGDEELDEFADPGADFLAEVVQQWEQEARALQEDPHEEVAVAWMRSGIVLSTEGGALAEMLNPIGPVKPFHWGLGGPVGSGEQWFPWIHIEDEVRAVLHILDERLEGPFNLVAPSPVRNKRFVEAIGSALDRPTKLPVPKLALRIMYGEAAELLFASQRVVPKRLSDTEFTFSHANVEEALEDLVGSPTREEQEPPVAAAAPA